MSDKGRSETESFSARFREAWSAGDRPSIEHCMSKVNGEKQQEQFRELLSVELQERRKKEGDKPSQDEYLSRFPDQAEIVAELFDGFDSFHVSCDSTVGYESSGHNDVSVKRPGSRLSQLVSRYRLIKKLGQGGFGEVWLAYDEKLETHVAIKGPRTDRPLSEKAIRAFLDEARKTRQLECHGVVPVYDVVEEDGVCFVVMKYMKGGNLADKIQEAKRNNKQVMPPLEAAKLIAYVADALHGIHVKNFIHRDIKPHNILLDEDDKPYLADFGLAVDESELYQERAARVGTYAYMSPEQAQGKSNRASPQSDIYSLGVVLYELLTCRLPYEDVAKSSLEYLQKVVSADPPRRAPQTISPDVPAWIDQVCLKCISKDLTTRYFSAKLLANELRVTNGGTRTFGPVRKRTMVIGVASAIGLIGLGLLGMLVVDNLFSSEHPTGNHSVEKWVSLLSDNPKEVAFNYLNPLNKYSPYPDRRRLEVHSQADWTMLSFGQFRGRSFQAEFQAELGTPGSYAGFFWGLHEERESLGNQQVCWAIAIESLRSPTADFNAASDAQLRADKDLELIVRFDKFVLRESNLGTVKPERHRQAFAEISVSNKSVIRVNLRVMLGRVDVVTIDGKECRLDGNLHSAGLRNHQYPVGFVGLGNRIVFKSSFLKQLSEEFDD